MVTRRQVAWGLFLLIGIVAAGYAKILWFRARTGSPNAVARLGRELPPLPVFDCAGRAVDVAKAARGRKSIIAFYSGSCRTCQELLALLQPIPSGLTLFLIHSRSINSSQNSIGPPLAWASVFSDRNDVLSRSFPLAGVPVVLFVDEQGVLRDGLVGRRALYRLRKKLQAFAETNR